MHRKFDEFLFDLDQSANCGTVYYRGGMGFRAHTAPVFSDVSGDDGELLATTTFKFENLLSGINIARREAGLQAIDERAQKHLNRSPRLNFRPSPSQTRFLKDFYADDFGLYEAAA